MATPNTLVPHVANPSLEKELRSRVGLAGDQDRTLDRLEQLAVRVGLIQNRLEPQFSTPRFVIFAADHGLAVDNIAEGKTETTAAAVHGLLTARQSQAPLGCAGELGLMVVDSGIAVPVAPHDGFVARKIAHGTRNSRSSRAMSMEQAQAAIRAGIEIGESLDGNAVACAGMGVGSVESAVLVLSALSNVSPRAFLDLGMPMPDGLLDHKLRVLESVRQRHRELRDPLELLAAMGGFEVAMLVGLILSASARRFVILPDGLAACAALMLSSAIAPAVVEYCVFARSDAGPGLDRALSLFDSTVVLEPDTGAMDCGGARLAWRTVLRAVALLAPAK
jgi:nicotinate-nucleotide--dimethylbenzimidazole phosphoribosyltransferase